MLNISDLFPQIMNMANDKHHQKKLNLKKFVNLQNAFTSFVFDQSAWHEKVNSHKEHFVLAFPRDVISKVFSLPLPIIKYSVLAVDGSQIEMDTHELDPFFVLNVGKVAIHYGIDISPSMENVAKLFYEFDDLYSSDNVNRMLIKQESISELRFKMEISALQDLLIKHNTRNLALAALIDGRLVSWDKVVAEKKEFSAFRAPEFEELFELGNETNTAVAGYISGSRSSLVINALRVEKCNMHLMKCKNCKFLLDKDAPCNSYADFKDVDLFREHLKVGERSGHFYAGINHQTTSSLKQYQIGFFYINVGSEIARVEAPSFVLENTRLLNLLHWVVFDQAQKGMGYPISLQEAHYQAVITSSEKDQIFNLVKKQYNLNDISIRQTPKKLSKLNRIY